MFDSFFFFGSNSDNLYLIRVDFEVQVEYGILAQSCKVQCTDIANYLLKPNTNRSQALCCQSVHVLSVHSLECTGFKHDA